MTAQGLPRFLSLTLRGVSPLERMVSFDVDSLLVSAERAEGWDDFGDPAFLAPLRVLVDALQADTQLHLAGRLQMRTVILRALRARLRYTRHLADHPDAGGGPARAPLIVCGLPRTGTTYLHRLLAALPDLRGLPLWRLIEPFAPNHGPDRRLELALRRTRRMVWLSGGALDTQHLMRPELPDECGHLLRTSFLSASYLLAPLPAYIEALPDQDARQAYREYRDLLGILSAGDPRRLVLKEPFHTMFLPALFEAMPNAMVVQTHRDLGRVVPSFIKLITTAQSMVTHEPTSMTPVLQQLLTRLADRSVARAATQDRRVLDIAYRDLVRDPVQTVERIHEHHGLPFEPAWRDLLHRESATSLTRPANPYRAEDHGVDLDEVARQFETYIERFLKSEVKP